MKRMIAIFGLTATLGFCVSASAAPTEELRSQVNMMLSAPEYAPTKSEWLALGEDAESVLQAVAMSKKELAVKRGRAATALSYFKTATAKLALTQIVKSDRESWLLRGKAARALALTYGEQSLAVVGPLLTNGNKRLREAAIRALSSVPARKSLKLLEAHAVQEKSPHLIRATKQAVVKLAATMLRVEQKQKTAPSGGTK